MARIRTIKPEFFTSEDIVELSPMARLLYISTWCEADKEGRLQWKPRTLKLRYFPADDINIVELCDELISAGLIVLYGEGLAYIPSFSKHQHVNPRESLSELPAPPGTKDAGPRKVGKLLREEVMERDGHQCVRCGSKENLQIDHILPQSAGGPHIKENLRVLCRSCNAARPVAGAALDDDLAIDGYTTESLAVKLGIDASNSEITDREEGKGKEGKGKEGTHDASDDASPKPRTQSASRFAEFWQAWPAGPRKQARAECDKKWKARGLDDLADEIIGHVRAILKTKQFQDFTPAPLTYLNQRRWEDGAPSSGDEQPESSPFRGAL